MDNHIRIYMAQMNPTLGDLDANAVKIIDALYDARDKKADIVMFPELAVCGYPPEDLLFKKHFIDDSMQALQKIEKETDGLIAVVGCLDTDTRGRVYNAAAVMSYGKTYGIYHKMKLPNYGVFDEKRYFAEGNRNVLFRYGKLTFGVTICEDVWEEDQIYKLQADSGANMLLNISASPFHAGKIKIRKKMLAGRARETACHICYLNVVGGQDELVFDGGSFVFNKKGAMIASGKHFEEDAIVVDIALNDLAQRKIQKKKNTTIVNLPKTDHLKRKRMRNSKAPILPLEAEIYKALVLGVRDYVRKNGFKKVVIGLSGGIDSALTVTIAVDALGKENVTGISMPSEFTSEGTQTDAKKMAENLGVRFFEIPIGAMVKSYHMSLRKVFRSTEPDETEENIQARIRGNILMACSNKFGWLVLTTGNKSETAVGYCTLYGDMAGGFAVIKDVSKTLVYELAAYRNSLEKKNVIPKSIINRAPSAELRAGQKDQDSLPPYDVLDYILREYIEEDKSFDTIAKRYGNASVVRDVIRLVDRNEYKRRQSPPGIKITPKSFGRDRRMPITNRYGAV